MIGLAVFAIFLMAIYATRKDPPTFGCAPEMVRA